MMYSRSLLGPITIAMNPAAIPFDLAAKHACPSDEASHKAE